jgi:two-component system chemotaxis response regulator CheB
MANRDIIVIGGSTGSGEVLKAIVRALPADLPASVFINTHLPSHLRSYLPGVLAKVAGLPVEQAAEGAEIAPGRIYVAAPDRHMLLLNGRIRMGTGPRENMVRPAIDALFRSAALSYGPRAIGVVLTGLLNDGASGLLAIRDAGGLTVVQDPADAEAPDMPRAALALLDPDHLLSAEAIGPWLATLSGTEASAASGPSLALKMEVEIAAGAHLGSEQLRKIADPVPLSCPECEGVLSEVRGARPRRFRCQIGHAYTAEVVDNQLDGRVEDALRIAMRVMEERVELVTRMARDASESGRNSVADVYAHRAAEYRRYAEALRAAVLEQMSRAEAELRANDDDKMHPAADEGEKLG